MSNDSTISHNEQRELLRRRNERAKTLDHIKALKSHGTTLTVQIKGIEISIATCEAAIEQQELCDDDDAALEQLETRKRDLEDHRTELLEEREGMRIPFEEELLNAEKQLQYYSHSESKVARKGKKHQKQP